MDHNPFISKNNDIFIMLVAGILIHFFNTYLMSLTVQSQFVLVLLFSFSAGLLMNYLYQSLEWALFFLLGIQIVSASPFLIHYISYGDFSLIGFIQHSFNTRYYSLFLLSSWIIGIPMGYMVQKIFMNNYYRKRLF